MYKKIVISLGGSILVPDKINVDFAKKFAKLVKKYKKDCRFSIVVGGGKTARKYALTGKKLGLNDEKAHRIGIAATHLNAKFIASLVDGKFSREHPREIGKKRGLIVSGGFKPGWTTDTDAAYIAKTMKAEVLVNITDVKGVYTKNPKKYKDAQFLPELGWKKFFDIVGTEVKPSGHYVFDPIAGKVCKNNEIKVVVLSSDLKNLERFIRGKDFNGTIIG